MKPAICPLGLCKCPVDIFAGSAITVAIKGYRFKNSTWEGVSSQCGRMALSHSVKERTISENSLIILLQGLQGKVTTVDLRDESVAHGRIDNVDAFMNIRLAQVTYTDRWGHQVRLDDLFVTGRNVRYVHIPDDVNITATIEEQLQIIHRVRNFGGQGKGRKEFPSRKSK